MSSKQMKKDPTFERLPTGENDPHNFTQKSTSKKKTDLPWMDPTKQNKEIWEERKAYYRELFKKQREEKSKSTKKGGKRRKPRKTKKHRKKKSL